MNIIKQEVITKYEVEISLSDFWGELANIMENILSPLHDCLKLYCPTIGKYVEKNGKECTLGMATDLFSKFHYPLSDSRKMVEEVISMIGKKYDLEYVSPYNYYGGMKKALVVSFETTGCHYLGEYKININKEEK